MLKKILKWLGIIFGGIVGALIVTAIVDALLLYGLFFAVGVEEDRPRQDGSWQRQISTELLVNVRDASVLSEKDTHGGFLGDGTAMVVLEMAADGLPEGMADNPNWKALPMPDALAEEIYDERGWFADQEGNLFVPEVKNGYYLLIDRHVLAEDIFSAEGLDDFERYSQNYTVGIYDADENILYYLSVDT